MAMLGSKCSPCCNSDCECEVDDLPLTVTVTLQIPSVIRLVYVDIESTFGSGAEISVFGEVGDQEDPGYPEAFQGEITSATVDAPGSGYARIIRVSPALTATAAGGSGASFTVNMGPSGDSFAVSSVTVVDGGSGYANNAGVTFTPGGGVTQLAAASATVRTIFGPPTGSLTITSDAGTGATLSAPTFTEKLFGGSPQQRFFEIASEYLDDLIVQAGSGYSLGDLVTFTVTDGVTTTAFSAEVDIIGDNGEIVGIFVTNPGSYQRDTGVIFSVVVSSGGSYYAEDVELAELTFNVTQWMHSEGEGLVLSADIDDDVNSETFGQIVGITVVDGGEGYMPERQRGSCLAPFDDAPLVLTRPTGIYQLRYSLSNCLFSVEADFYDFDCTLQLRVNSPIGWFFNPGNTAATFSNTEKVVDCDSFDLNYVMDGNRGITARVESGGEYTGELPYELPDLINITATSEYENFLYSCPFTDTPSYNVRRNELLTIVNEECGPPYENQTNLESCDATFRLNNWWASFAPYVTLVDTDANQWFPVLCNGMVYPYYTVPLAELSCGTDLGGQGIYAYLRCKTNEQTFGTSTLCPEAFGARLLTSAGFDKTRIRCDPFEATVVYEQYDSIFQEWFEVTMTITEAEG